MVAKRIPLTQVMLRSAITNGRILDDVDHRTKAMRRLRDLLAQYADDLGGDAHLSEGQRALIRRAAMLEIQLTQIEERFAEEGNVGYKLLDLYGRHTGNLRRVLESLGLNHGRRARDVTPPSLRQYVNSFEASRDSVEELEADE
jgi:hypothetical protein